MAKILKMYWWVAAVWAGIWIGISWLVAPLIRNWWSLTSTWSIVISLLAVGLPVIGLPIGMLVRYLKLRNNADSLRW